MNRIGVVGPDLPDLVDAPAVRVRTELRGDVLRHVAEVRGGHSAAGTRRAIADAGAALRDVPEVISHVEAKVDRHAAAALEAAARKRARRARRGW